MTDDGSARRCQWCDTVSGDAAATNCANCGAALILRESFDGIRVPGVTEVDPDLQVYANKPLRIPRGSVSQAAAGPVVAAAALGGPAAVIALGALGVTVAKEYADAGGSSKPAAKDRVGVPSEAVVEMVNKLNAQAADKGEAADMDEPATPADDPPAMP